MTSQHSSTRRAPALPRPALFLAFIIALGLTGCELEEPAAGPAATAAATPTQESTGRPSATAPTPSNRPKPTPTPTVTPRPGRAEAQARSRLRSLVVRPRPVGTLGYDRDAFGPSWTDIEGNGCNQRDDVLLRDAVRGSTRVQQQGACDHDVLAGTWVDPYTGRTLRFTDLKDLSQAQAIQIDHIVPLAEAWVSGANRWSEDRRERYANTLAVLLAVDGPTNASKGADDPAAWRPRKGYQCRYAIRWISIKHTWQLAADPSEVRGLRDMLGFC